MWCEKYADKGGKMKKTFGKLGWILAMFIGVFTLSLNEKTVYADEPQYLGTVIDGSVLTDQSEAEDLQQTRLRNSYLAQGFVKITNKGNGVVGIGGSTTCFVTCDTVKFNLYLERSKGDSNFSSYKSFTYTANNAHSLTKSLSYAVEKGYYYRLRGYHYASKDGKAENLISRTNGIYIG